MDQQARHVAEASVADSDKNAPFPEIVTRLMTAGFERYHADLRRGEKTFYMADGASHVVACEPVRAPFAEAFSAEDVRAAVKAIQQREITYLEFCARIARAGCVGYLVSFPGQRALYYGRTAENYVESFPPSN